MQRRVELITLILVHCLLRPSGAWARGREEVIDEAAPRRLTIAFVRAKDEADNRLVLIPERLAVVLATLAVVLRLAAWLVLLYEAIRGEHLRAHTHLVAGFLSLGRGVDRLDNVDRRLA